jgi:hypothetical protein
MSPTLFIVFIGQVIRRWKDVLNKEFEIDNTVLNIILFADDHTIFSGSEADLQRAVNKLENIANVFNMRFFNYESKNRGISRENHVRSKTVIDNKIEQVSSFNYLAFNASCSFK